MCFLGQLMVKSAKDTVKNTKDRHMFHILVFSNKKAFPRKWLTKDSFKMEDLIKLIQDIFMMENLTYCYIIA